MSKRKSKAINDNEPPPVEVEASDVAPAPAPVATPPPSNPSPPPPAPAPAPTATVTGGGGLPGTPAEHGIHQPRGRSFSRALRQLHRFTYSRVSGHALEKPQLIEAQAQSQQDFEVQPLCRTFKIFMLALPMEVPSGPSLGAAAP